MSAALTIVHQAYEAFGRRDIPALLQLVAEEVDWECVAPANLPYAGRRRKPAEVADFFTAIPEADDIHVFEPWEFIDAGEHVRVGLGRSRKRDSWPSVSCKIGMLRYSCARHR